MSKKVFIVPPQNVSVNVSVNVGQQPVAAPGPQYGEVPAPPQAYEQPFQQQVPAAQVNTSVHVGALGRGTTSGAGHLAQQGPYVPSFQMPTSDVLRRTIPRLARESQGAGIGDHVHDAQCAEHGCELLAAALPAPVRARPWAIVGWLLVALCVWAVQYSLIVPLVWLGAVARSGGARAVGWIAILLCGFGPFYSLFYVVSPAVPNRGLTPWGLSEIQPR